MTISCSHASVRASIVTAVTAAAMFGCGASAPPVADERPDVVDCSRNWQVIYDAEIDADFPARDELLLSGDQLYQYTEDAGLITVPANGGPARTIAIGASHYWVERDQLVFVNVGYRSGELHTLPLPSGEPTTVRFDVNQAERADGFPAGYALDEGAFYWLFLNAYKKPMTLTLWRVSRVDGSHSKQADTPVEASRDRFFRVGDRLVVLLNGGPPRLWSFPLAGGPPTELLGPEDAQTLLGMSDDGRAIVARQQVDGASQITAVYLSQWSIDGAEATPWWTSKPLTLSPSQVWDDGTGGFYAAALERTVDGALHAGVWSVDRTGTSKRLACDPEVQGEVLGAAVGSDAVNLTISYENHWRIVRVAKHATP